MGKQRRQQVSKHKKATSQEESKPSWYIGTDADAAPWMLRPYIVRGYRIGFTRTWQSLFTLHNETSNVWSHLLAAFLFIWFTLYVFIFMAVPRMPAFPHEWCPRLSTEAINQFLESNGIVNHPEPHGFHSGYNHHTEAFERIESMVFASYEKLRSVNQHCLQNLLSLIPTFMTQSYFESGSGHQFFEQKMANFLELTERMRQHLQSPNPSEDLTIEHVPRWPLFVYLGCAISMLLFSASYHNNYCKNEKTFDFLLKLDYVGIGVMIAGGSLPVFYYGYMCNLQYFVIVWGLIFFLCVIASLMMMYPRLFGLTSQSCQQGFVAFTSAGLVSIPGVLHLNGYLEEIGLKLIDMDIFLVGGAFYLLGGLIYAMHWPERSYIARFDYFGNSHNIFHLAIVCAALIHFYGSVRVFHERQLYGCPATNLAN